MTDDPFVIAGVEFTSRLILGTGGAPSLQVKWCHRDWAR